MTFLKCTFDNVTVYLHFANCPYHMRVRSQALSGMILTWFCVSWFLINMSALFNLFCKSASLLHILWTFHASRSAVNSFYSLNPISDVIPIIDWLVPFPNHKDFLFFEAFKLKKFIIIIFNFMAQFHKVWDSCSPQTPTPDWFFPILLQ